uniref:histidine phosphatase family protein n=1 Tax=Bacillus subtilis TaxID=1423 RepID=UPI0016434D1E
MTGVCLVRDGERDWNVEEKWEGKRDMGVKGRGESEGRERGEYVKGFCWDIIVRRGVKRGKRRGEMINEYV